MNSKATGIYWYTNSTKDLKQSKIFNCTCALEGKQMLVPKSRDKKNCRHENQWTITHNQSSEIHFTLMEENQNFDR